MARAKQWIAADISRCQDGRCFRIDAVTLADRGVAFSRGAIGAHPSLVVRRAFSASRTSMVAVMDDPQPDLVPSSSGALYYALSGGWHRWDFGEAQPRRVRFLGAPPATLLSLDDGRALFVTNKPCQVAVIADAGGRRRVVASPGQVRASMPGSRRAACVQLLGATWAGRQPLTAWALISSEKQLEEHRTDQGVFGVVIAGEELP